MAAVQRFKGVAAQAPFTVSTTWAEVGFKPTGTRNNPDENVLSTSSISQLDTAWIAATGGSIESSPAVANGVVYVGSGDKELYAFDAGTGSLIWNVATGGSISSSPAVANGVVYVGSEDNKLYAFDAGTGSLMWSAITGSSITSSPAIANGVVY